MASVLTLAQSLNIAKTPTFVQRVRSALMTHAQALAANAGTTPAPQLALIGKVTANPDFYAELFGLLICTGYNCAGGPETDANLIAQVGSAWTDFAGQI